jgi:two-component system cell cycle response regulator
VTLRARLLVAFVAVFLVPIAVGGILLARGVPRAVNSQATNRLHAAESGIASFVAQACTTAVVAAQGLAEQEASLGPRAAVATLIRQQAVAAAAVTGSGGRLLAQSGWRWPVPTSSGCVGRSAAGVAALTATVNRVTTAGRFAGRASVAILIRPRDLRAALAGSSVSATLTAGPRVLTSTVPAGLAKRLAVGARGLRSGSTAVVAGLLAAARSAGSGLSVVVAVSQPSTGAVQALVIGVLVAALLVAAVVGWRLATLTTRPLSELSEAAARVAEGDLDTRIDVHSDDEVGRLAGAFNEMTDHLRDYIGELEASRDELRRSLSLVGDTLSGTHDMNRILEVILEAAMAGSRATAGAVYLTLTGRGELSLRALAGFSDVETLGNVPVGAGIVGRVAEDGAPVCGTADGALPGRPASPRLPAPHPAEPSRWSALAVPLRISGAVAGVLALYERHDGQPFDDADLETVRSFAGQATVALDNVLLHQEAQRLSITDGLTGLWNYRYFQMNLAKEIERSARFRRPLALLMLDLDRFKQVNDTYGHQRGDSVLVELATRVKAQTREIDILARYGGEEFVLVLPETGLSGAEHTAERICQVVRERPFTVGDEEPLTVTVSVGIAVFPDHGTDGQTLVAAADRALYGAKNAGRDTWTVADPAIPRAR